MKKFYLALAVCLAFAGNARAENFVEALGAECGRILFSMRAYTYPDVYRNIIKRNTQFDAVEKCLDLYKQNGGDVQELDRRYFNADSLAACAYSICEKEISTSGSASNDCFDRKASVFNDVVRREVCTAYWAYKDEFSGCGIISVLKGICEKDLSMENSIDK